MKRVALILAIFGALTVAASPVLAGHPNVHRYSHHGHHGTYGFYGGYRPIVVTPVPVYPYTNYPAVVYPQVYPVPQPYYYPGTYLQYRTRGLSFGIGF
jgi:hypothetical protein